MDVRARKIDSVTVLDVEGSLVLSEDKGKLHCLLGSLLQENQRHFILNMQNVNLMDCAGIGQLVLFYRRVLEKGGDLKLLNLDQRLHYLLKMMRLLTVIEAFDNEQEAISSFSCPAIVAARIASVQSPYASSASPQR